MSLFKREQASVPHPVTEMPPESMIQPDVCSPSNCVEADPVIQELSRSDEIRLSIIDDAAGQWYSTLSTGKKEANVILQELESLDVRSNRQSAANGTGRSPVNTWAIAGKSIVGKKADVMAMLRNDALTELRRGSAFATGVSEPLDVLLGHDRQALGKLSDYASCQTAELKQPKPGFPLINLRKKSGGNPALEVINPYYRVFLAETKLRAEIAIGILEAPVALARILSPSQLDELEPDMQAAVHVDLMARQRSVTRRFLTTHTDENTQTLFEYLCENDIAPQAKELARAVAVGTKALGGCDCPMNTAGLCRSSADKIPLAEIPTVIAVDMQKKMQTQQAAGKTALDAFMRKHQLPDWWSMEATILPMTYHGHGPSSDLNPLMQGRLPRKGGKRVQSTSNAASTLLKSTESLPEISALVAPSTVVLSIKGDEQSQKFDLADPFTSQSTAEALSAHKVVADYIAAHPGQANLPEMITASLAIIVGCANYREERSLVPMTYAQKHRSRIDSRELAVWRLSGQDLSVSAGKIGRDTRIYFGISNKGGIRRIELISIVHKDDVVKQSRRGTLLT